MKTIDEILDNVKIESWYESNNKDLHLGIGKESKATLKAELEKLMAAERLDEQMRTDAPYDDPQVMFHNGKNHITQEQRLAELEAKVRGEKKR